VSAEPFLLPDSLALNPANPQQLMTAEVDFSCMAVFHTNDGGATWTRTCGPRNVGLGSAAAYSPTGIAYLVGGGQDKECAPDCDENIGSFASSADNGTTWSPAILAVPHTLGFGVEDFAIQVDGTASSPHYGTIYISATQFGGLAQNTISVSHSTDGGATWTTVNVDAQQTPPLRDDFSHLAIGRDGTVYVTWMRCSRDAYLACPGRPATMFVSRSTDGGNTWTPASIMATTNIVPSNPGCPTGSVEDLPNSCWVTTNEPVIAVDNSTGPFAGRLYVVYYNWTGTFMQVVEISSSDEGNTWSPPVPVTPTGDTHDQFGPWVSVSQTGLVGVTWQDRRNDPANVMYEAFAGFSRNGGASFAKNVKLATAASDPTITNLGRAYPTANVWAGSTLEVIWQDTRSGTQQVVFGGARPK
jgi:hypothetical protein